MKTLQDYIKLAADLKMKADIMTMGERIAWGSDTALMYQASEALPAMAKALIEAEEALKASMLTMKNHRIHAPDTLSLQKTALAQIQALNGGEE